MDDNNKPLVTADMKAAVEAAKADIISGKLKVHDYMADNTCPAAERNRSGSRRARLPGASVWAACGPRGLSVLSREVALAPAIELDGIDKRFGAVHANKAIDLVVERGTIHGIVGENGAGKSTLMSILYGFYEADAGEIRVNGTARRIRSSQDAIAAGIGMVHQHFMLVETFTVLENVMLGAEGGSLLGQGEAQPAPNWSGWSATTTSRSIPTRSSGTCRSAASSASRS